MKQTKQTMSAVTTTRILLGLVMLSAGLLKFFMFTPAGVSKMLGGIALFAWAPGFWAWVLILSEIIFGIAVIANYKLRLTTIPLMIILFVAAFTAHLPIGENLWKNLGDFLMRLTLVSILWVYKSYDNE